MGALTYESTQIDETDETDFDLDSLYIAIKRKKEFKDRDYEKYSIGTV